MKEKKSWRFRMQSIIIFADLSWDVFQNVRSVCLKAYNLDPCHFYTSPGIVWQACLKMTEVELELLTDLDIYLFNEEGLRGEISMITNRFSKANNSYVPDYDPTQENSYVMYFDANNLYGWGKSKSLPTCEFDWLTEQEIADLDITMDLHYPSELHDLHNDIENLRKRVNVKLVNNKTKLSKLIEHAFSFQYAWKK